MEPVQQESHELLGIMLGITCKLTGFTGYNRLCRHKQTTKERGGGSENPHHIVLVTFAIHRFPLGESESLLGYLEF